MARLLRSLLALFLVTVSAWSAAAPLRVITSDATPPFMYRDPNGHPVGYTADLWRLWEKKTGIPVELTATDWAVAQQRMLAGQADVIDLIFRTPAREPLYDFSAPFATIHTGIYTDKSISGIHDPQGLKGFLVGVQDGDACVEKLRGAGITMIRTFRDFKEMAGAAAREDVKIFCLDEYPAGYYLYRFGLQNRFNKAFDFYQNEFRHAVRKGDAQTLALVNRGMAMITPAEEA
ncbi:MAG TPA: transporter substrate-binding domain-containing protein, partial [Telluria sp.]|nr:transporter substrate-binding domain-containing protein [Telluria sp.]